MKFKTFRGLLVAGGLAVVGGGAALWAVNKKDAPPPVVTSKPETPGPVPRPEPPRPEPPVTPPATTPAAANALRPMDSDILGRLKQGIAGDKVKDVYPGKSYKVSLYKDAGQSAVNRVKIDLDRDDKWDEKWTLTGDAIKRQVSPSDDDKTYTLEFMLAGDHWEAPAGQATAPPSPGPAEVADGAEPLRPMDNELIGRATQGIAGDKEKDVTAGKPYKVSLFKDAGQTRVNRAKIDLDRDEKWDEKWTFSGDEIKRQVAPADDEVYTVEYRLRAGAWVKK